MAQQTTNRPRIDPKQLRKSLLIWGAVAVVVVGGTQLGWSNIWREGVIRPMLNGLLWFYAVLGRNVVVAIAALTILLRFLTLPLQIKQIRSSRKTASLQPHMAEIQKKYAGNREKLAQEQQKLYKEANVNPLGGCLPTLVQFPIWIGLYRSINSVLADTPIELMALGQDMYSSFARALDVIPLQSVFLGMDLAKPDPTRIVLPVLVAGTMWLQQKMMTQPSADAQQAQMNQTMQLMMPLMFGYFTMQFASGLAIYFVISNVVGVIIQWISQRIEGPISAEAGASAGKDKKAADGTKASKRDR